MIMVFCQQENGELQRVGLELLGKAKDLADQFRSKLDKNVLVTGVILGNDVQHLVPILVKYGADKVIVAQHDLLEQYNVEIYTKVFFEILLQEKPEIMLIGATQLGRELAPRLAARLKTGLTADCTQLEIDKDTGLLEMTRPAFGGNLMATIICPNHRPQIATVRPGVFPIPESSVRKSAIIVEFSPKIYEKDLLLNLLDSTKKVRLGRDITEAQIIVAGGRGIGSKDGFKKLYELAQLIDGEVAGSRAAVDNGWLEKDRQVGQTGKVVRPKLYIAIGISGAIQHLAGMQESGYIIAINKDSEAPIMKVADLGIVGDWKEIVDKLVKKLRKVKNNECIVDSLFDNLVENKEIG